MMEGNSKSGGCVLGVTNLDHSLQSPNLTARAKTHSTPGLKKI